MPNKFYPVSVETFTDEQIKVLMAEIEESGIVDDDVYWEWPEDSWEAAAAQRWNALVREDEKRRGIKPASITELSRVTHAALARFVEKTADYGDGLREFLPNWQNWQFL